MRQFLFIFMSMGLLVSCVQEKGANNDLVLSLPFGKYYKWTKYELKQLNFRLGDNELLIDTTYNLKPHEFKTHYVESPKDYPEITKLLKKTLTELHDLQNPLSKIKCDNLNTFYIQYETGTKLDRLEFGAGICDPTLSPVYQEMKKLKDKYKP